MNETTKAELVVLKETHTSIQERRNWCDKEALRLLVDYESKDFSKEKFDELIVALREIDMVLAVTAYRRFQHCSVYTAYNAVIATKNQSDQS